MNMMVEMTECDSTINKIHQTSVDIESPTPEPLELASVSPNDPVTCDSIHAALVLNPDFYFFAAIAGLIIPNANEYPKPMTTLNCFRFRMWSIFISAGWFFGLAIYVTTFPYYPDNYKALYFFIYFSLALQFIILYPAMTIARKMILTKREIIVKNFHEQWTYALHLSWKIFAFWTLLSVLDSIIFSVSDDIQRSVVNISIEALFFLVLQFPPNMLMMGILCFLVYEQRLSRQMMDGILTDIDSEQLSLKKYFFVRQDMEKRDQGSPVNLILLSCTVNVVVGLTLTYWVYVELDDKDIGDNALNTFDVIAYFGRPYIFIVVFLLEIIGVNERADKVVRSIAKYDLESEVDQTYRFGIYMAAKEYPLGSMIFFARPSRLQLLTEVGSSFFGIFLSVMWTLFN